MMYGGLSAKSSMQRASSAACRPVEMQMVTFHCLLMSSPSNYLVFQTLSVKSRLAISCSVSRHVLLLNDT